MIVDLLGASNEVTMLMRKGQGTERMLLMVYNDMPLYNITKEAVWSRQLYLVILCMHQKRV
jgi:hypothetical protein